jgi:hypothetical protein
MPATACRSVVSCSQRCRRAVRHRRRHRLWRGLVETDLTVEDLRRRPSTRSGRHRPGRPDRLYGLKTPVDREVALSRMGLAMPASSRRVVREGLSQLAPGWWQPLPRDAAGRGRRGLRDAPLGLAEPGQGHLRRVPQAGTRAEPGLAQHAARRRARLPAGGHGRPRRLLVGDGVRAAVRRGEPVADARCRRSGPSAR